MHKDTLSRSSEQPLKYVHTYISILCVLCYSCCTVVPLFRPSVKGGLQKRWSLMRLILTWATCTFVTSKAASTKGVVFHEGGLSKGVLMYYNGHYDRKNEVITLKLTN